MKSKRHPHNTTKTVLAPQISKTIRSWVASYTMAELLEVTITHNLTDPAEVRELFREGLIALDWGRLGPDPNLYAGRGRIDVNLFHTMRQQGAAVIAAYKKATPNPSDRLVGWVDAGVEFRRYKDLLCLPLSRVKLVDSSANFLGNLAPRQCTVQRCGNRAKGRLAGLVLGQPSPRGVESLHHHDVEWLVTNYLIVTGLCTCVWSGGQTFEDIDHAGRTIDGHELLAQTTISENLVGLKGAKLRALASPNRALHLFGPAKAAAQCPPGIEYHSIETVFSELDRFDGGQWLIDRMLSPIASETRDAT